MFELAQLADLRAQRDQLAVAPLSHLRPPAAAGQRITWVGDLQQGDGGKGAMTDRLADAHHLVVRVQGGDNAGHTTVFQTGQGEAVIRNHIVPSGLRRGSCVGLLANGVLLNPEQFVCELDALAPYVPDIAGRVFVSDRAHLVLPLHWLVDSREEDRLRLAAEDIGTTRRGIGPANVSKAGRFGIRVGDLRDMKLVRSRIKQCASWFALPRSVVEHNVDWVDGYREVLLSRAVDSVRLVNAAADQGYSLLFEGAQGPLIDIEHGIYPYVTTSPTAVYSVGLGSGLDIARITHRVGVLKAYQTMVGNGAFVSEDHGELSELLRARGNEFGTTTSRPRRCGWLDLLHARWAVELNRYTSVVVTKLDVLDEFEQIAVCVAYERRGRRLYDFLPYNDLLAECTPVFQYLDGWRTPTTGVKSYDELPAAARALVDFIGGYLQVPISGVTKGPREEDLLVRPGSELDDRNMLR